MQILNKKIMFLLEKDIDFTDNDLITSVTKDQYLKKECKQKFIEKNGFDIVTQQFPIYQGSNGKIYAQIECEKKT